jgi:hypothetical protein
MSGGVESVNRGLTVFKGDRGLIARIWPACTTTVTTCCSLEDLNRDAMVDRTSIGQVHKPTLADTVIAAIDAAAPGLDAKIEAMGRALGVA